MSMNDRDSNGGGDGLIIEDNPFFISPEMKELERMKEFESMYNYLMSVRRSFFSGTCPQRKDQQKEYIKIFSLFRMCEINEVEKRRKELFDACSRDDFIKAKEILTSHMTFLNEVIDDSLGWTILMRSAYYGANKIIEYLLSLPDINIHHLDKEDEDTALHIASYCGKTEIVKLLLQHPQINVNIQNKRGDTPLHDAVRTFQVACIELLSNHPAVDQSIKNQDGITAFELKHKILSLLPSLKMSRWNRSKIMLVGQGRAGKTTFTNNLMGRLFKKTIPSGTGLISAEDREIYRGKMNKHKNKSKKDRLPEYMRPEKEYKAHNLNLLRRESSMKTLGFGEQRHVFVGSLETSISPIHLRKESLRQINFTAMIKEAQNVAEFPDDAIRSLSSHKISLYNFEGPSILNVLHPFFMSRYGVYLLVFDMELFLSEDAAKRASCHKELKFWLNSIAMHTYDMGSQKTAPVALIGTRKDKIGRREDHEAISVELEEKYRGSEVWGSLIRYEVGEGNEMVSGNEKKTERAKSTLLSFFPCNNNIQEIEIDEVSEALLLSIETITSEANSKLEQIPIEWIKILDEMESSERSFLLYDEFEELTDWLPAQLDGKPIPKMLRFLNDMGMLMWIEEEGLKDIIILDPINHLVKPMLMIISKDIATKDNRYETKHAIQGIHDECEEEYGEDWMRMLEYGMVSGRLARCLLDRYYKWDGNLGMKSNDARIEMILKRMTKHGVAVPITIDSSTSEVSHHNKKSRDEIFFVPALLPAHSSFLIEKENPLNRRPHRRYEILEEPWSRSIAFSFFFYLPSGRVTDTETASFINKAEFFSSNNSLYSEEELIRFGLLPNGLFERLIGPCVQKIVMSSSASSSSEGEKNNVLNDLMVKNELIIAFQEKILLTYHHHRVRMTNRLEENRIEVEIEMHDDDDGEMKEEEKEKERELIVKVCEEMLETIERLLRECYSPLRVITVLPNPVSHTEQNSRSSNCFLSFSSMRLILAGSDSVESRRDYDVISHDGNCKISFKPNQMKPDLQFFVRKISKNGNLFRAEKASLLLPIAVIGIIIVMIISRMILLKRKRSPASHQSSDPTDTLPLPEGKRTHVFLSHDWGVDGNNHLRVKQINEALKSRGLITWLDDDRGREGESGITSEIPRTIAKAIEETACMIVFVTENYRNKVNSRDDLDYCRNEFICGLRYLTAKKMLVVVSEPRVKDAVKWDRLLGNSFGQVLFCDFSSVFSSSSSSGLQSQEIFDRLIDELDDNVRQLNSDEMIFRSFCKNSKDFRTF